MLFTLLLFNFSTSRSVKVGKLMDGNLLPCLNSYAEHICTGLLLNFLLDCYIMFIKMQILEIRNINIMLQEHYNFFSHFLYIMCIAALH